MDLLHVKRLDLVILSFFHSILISAQLFCKYTKQTEFPLNCSDHCEFLKELAVK